VGAFASPNSDSAHSRSAKDILDMQDDPITNTADATAIIEQYRQIAQAAIADAEIWLHQGALSRAIPEVMPDAIMVVDTTGTIVSVNAKFELMFGYHRTEVVGQKPELVVPEGARARHVELRRKYSENPRIRDMSGEIKLRGRRKDGVEIDLLIKLGPVVIPSGTFTIAFIRKLQD
jgi:PAS domain S-box-containing protein